MPHFLFIRLLPPLVLSLLLSLLLTVTLRSHADTIRMAVGLALPPYVIATENRGMELDIVREALALGGHQLLPVYVPFARVPDSFKLGHADAAMTVTEAAGLAAFYSDEHIEYRNTVVALAERGLTITAFSDLLDYSLLAFQNASHYLPAAYQTMAAHHQDYREIAQQNIQVAMLFSGRIDAIVLDINIFNYYRRQERKIDVSAEVQFFMLFPPTHYKIAFARQSWRDDFNRGLQQLRSSGRYQQILDAYLRPEGVSVSPDTAPVPQ
ncbi:substrate-binding periplasmic protein [Thalassolituus hydrocarboniclasticus]|uniref:ABC transporter substrate-binding protein n=1 Tax=Thalassolituus hydrocarboniclasticus TaxID=2742796 RepID=A0ABY6AEG0_9GAMM|nr:ABC transporter substrate-binding protein [Thalassolituus hydrocarboniclasticus]UXD89045.1 ABC transporter substrate-binding protein [Thalassolituus hydrocarboniclasticus]